jgi:hypothetical protein
MTPRRRILLALCIGALLGAWATAAIRPALADGADQMYRIVRALETIASNSGKCK